MRQILGRAMLLGFLLSIGSSLAMVGLDAQQGTADAKGKAEDKAQKMRGASDKDPNIKAQAGPNDPKNEPPAPAKKGGQQTRGAACYINFDNRTPWRIEAYVDGTFRGVVPPYGDLATVTGDGWTTIYARALFTDGSVLTWGPRRGMCVNEAFNWQLTR